MSLPIVLVAEELSPAGIAQLESGFDVRYADGADRSKLLPALADADAVIIRSATTIDAEALAHAPWLRVVARAGVGLDNVDVEAATKAGVMVVERAHLQHRQRRRARRRPAARGRAERAAGHGLAEGRRSGSGPRITGVELQDKVVGILGLGQIGVLVAQRLAAFGMTVIAYDPYVAAARAAQLGVRLVSLDELLADADFISVHLPKNAETIGLIGDRELRIGQARGADHQRGARRHRGRGRAGQRAQGRPGRRRRRWTSTPASRAPTARCSGSATSSSPRTWARAPTRRRRRRAPRWPGRCGWRWRASSCRTRSTCRAAWWTS